VIFQAKTLIISPTLTSNLSALIGISGVWNGFFITKSAYASYILCKAASAVVSVSEVSSTNLIAVRSQNLVATVREGTK
jgi:hypothetical protein